MICSSSVFTFFSPVMSSYSCWSLQVFSFSFSLTSLPKGKKKVESSLSLVFIFVYVSLDYLFENPKSI